MRKIVVVLVIALIASTAWAYSLWNQLQAERELSAQLRAQPSNALPVPGRHAPASSAAADPSTPPPRTAIGERSSPPESSPAIDGRPPDGRARQLQLLKDPRYVEALREQRRLNYRLRRDNAMRLFGFSRETADAIIDLDVDYEISMMPIMMDIDGSQSASDQNRQYEDTRRDHDAKMLALLGQDRYDRWQTYMETRGTRMQVDQFRSQLDGADALRDDQVEPLITALAAEQKQLHTDLDEYRNSLDREGDSAESSHKFREKQIEIIKAANQRMLASAASILSASQTKRLADMLSFDLQQRAMQDRMERLRNRIGPAPTSDAGSD